MRAIRINTQPSLFLFVVIAIFVFSCDDRQENKKTTGTENSSSETVSPQKVTTPDKNILVGDWVRTDAPYQIKITELHDDGKVKVGYFNPKSINIGNATWTNEDGVLKVNIELRDENYPGSKYDLTYIQGQGMLAGNYFQAVEGVTYHVGFIKAK